MDWSKKCDDFSQRCQKRVGLLESYKKEADKLIEDQAALNVKVKNELEMHERTNHYLIPLLGIAAGFIGGAILIKK